MEKRFEGQHVVVTGGDGGLGQTVVRAFVAAGAVCHLPILGTAVQSEPGIEVAPGVNLTDESAVEGYFAGLPPIAASIHLAGGFLARPVAETSKGDLEKQLALNLMTAFLCSREAIKAFRKSGGGGRIVNVAARVVEAPPGGMVAYAVSKAGVAALTRSLADEVKQEGIFVNAILPSIIDTPANRASMPKADFDRWPKASELAEAILWLASAENKLTSGALVPVYGRA